MSELTELARQVQNAIPLTRHLAFSYEHFAGLTLTLNAPLAPNGNDKGTFFAGSQAALATLAGWSMTTLQANHAGLPCDVVAVESQMRYTLPLQGDLHLEARIDEQHRTRFRERLARKGRAILSVEVTGQDAAAGATICTFQGVYLARRLKA